MEENKKINLTMGCNNFKAPLKTDLESFNKAFAKFAVFLKHTHCNIPTANFIKMTTYENLANKEYSIRVCGLDQIEILEDIISLNVKALATLCN